MRWQNAQLNTSLAQTRTRAIRPRRKRARRRPRCGSGSRSWRAAARSDAPNGAPARAAGGERATDCGRRQRGGRGGSAAHRDAREPAARRTGEGEHRRDLAQGPRRAGERQGAAAGVAGARRDWPASRRPGGRARRVAHPARGRRRRLEERSGQRAARKRGRRAARSGGHGHRVARENLIAVENQIRELNEAWGRSRPAGGPWKPILRSAGRARPLRKLADDGGRAARRRVANVAAAAAPSPGRSPGTRRCRSRPDQIGQRDPPG